MSIALLYIYIMEVENLKQQMIENQSDIKQLVDNKFNIMSFNDNPQEFEESEFNLGIFLDVQEYNFSLLCNFWINYCSDKAIENEFFLVDLLFGMHNLEFDPIIYDGQEFISVDVYNINCCTYHDEIQALLGRCDLENLKTQFEKINKPCFDYYSVTCEYNPNEIAKIQEIINYYQKCLENHKDIIFISLYD